MLGLFGDLATELLVRYDGDEGLFRAYDAVEFLAPVRAGDFIEARASITRVGKTSREMEFTAWRVISAKSRGRRDRRRSAARAGAGLPGDRHLRHAERQTEVQP